MHLSLPLSVQSQTARVVLWWESQVDREAGDSLNFSLLVKLFSRFRVVHIGALSGEELKVRWPMPPPGAERLHVVIDTKGTLLQAVLGGGQGSFVGVTPLPAPSPNSEVQVTLQKSPTQVPSEYCKGGRFRLLHVEAPYVAGWVGNHTRRRLCVYLPKSYETSGQQRYPTVFLLPGLASDDGARLRGDSSPRGVADELGADVILVGVDTKTVTGSTYFENSPASGEWMTFVDAMVAAVDEQFRTQARAQSRALIGQSTGGFNAVSLGFRRPDLFSVIGASAPDGLVLSRWLTEERAGQRFLRKPWLAWMRLEAAIAKPDYRQVGQFISYAADWSPGPNKSDALRWPADLQTGLINLPVYKMWERRSPTHFIADPVQIEKIRARFDDRVFLAVGKNDEFGLHEPTVAFSKALEEALIGHTIVVGEGTHGGGQDMRLRKALQFALSVFAKDAQ